MGLSGPNPTLKFRSVGGQILLASFWTFLVIQLAATLYCCCAAGFGCFRIMPSNEPLYHLLALCLMLVSIIPQAVLSLVMMFVYKPLGIVGLSALIPFLILLAIPSS